MSSDLFCFIGNALKDDSQINREMYMAACIRKNHLIKEAYYVGKNGEWEILANPTNNIVNTVGIRMSVLNKVASYKDANSIRKLGPNKVEDFEKIAEMGKKKYFEGSGKSRLRGIF